MGINLMIPIPYVCFMGMRNKSMGMKKRKPIDIIPLLFLGCHFSFPDYTLKGITADLEKIQRRFNLVSLPAKIELNISNNQAGVKSVTFTVQNHCPYTVWPATLTSKDTAITTGFELQSQASNTIDVPAQWSGRFWARFSCTNSSGKFTCPSGDCTTGQITCNGLGGKPPATLIEFTLSGSNNLDYYDISLVDGYNLPVSVAPQAGGCTTASCPVDIKNKECPNELIARGGDGSVVGCNSACVVFNKPEYCCTGDHGTPDKCPPTNYSQIFKQQCPQAYSYAYDDKTSLFTCKSGSGYTITFCP